MVMPRQHYVRLGELTVRLAETQQDLENIHAIEYPVFGELAFTVAQQQAWLKRFPAGIFVMERDVSTKAGGQGTEFLGNFHLWPVAPDLANRFKQGQLTYSDLLPVTMADVVAAGGWPLWRIASLFVEAAYRVPTADNPVALLLAHALNLWADSGHVSYPVELFSTGFTIQGQRLLERFGFAPEVPAEQMANQRPLFVKRATSKNDLFAILGQRGLDALLPE